MDNTTNVEIVNVKMLAEELQKRNALMTKKQAVSLVTETFNIIADNIAAGKRVKVKDFGAFERYTSSPAKGDKVNRVRFRKYGVLKARVL